MKILIHQKVKRVLRVMNSEGKTESLKGTSCAEVLWELAERFPGEVICWCEEEFYVNLQQEKWHEIFQNDLIMASYAIKSKFLPESIGYIDQLPFININRSVQFATWQMSADVGGIRGKTLLKFKKSFHHFKRFELLINSIAKIGQQNGLFCYSAPDLVNTKSGKTVSTASVSQLFSFVYSHYSTVWIAFLFWCLIKFENRFPLLAFLKSFRRTKVFRKDVDLSDITLFASHSGKPAYSLDIIIPTIGRTQHVFQVLQDLKEQTLHPLKVIIVEQNPDCAQQSDLSFIMTKKWPFKIVHHFTHKTGACNARNIALKEVSSEWVFFADDDIRIQSGLLEKAFKEIDKYDICALNMNCKQEGEDTVFQKVKQWGSFGSGTSIVKSSYAKLCSFSSVYEHGYGEDADYGMQLRNKGCDIIYHPEVQILHLKAPIGGFRQKPVLDWEKEEPLPKPSPTLMVYALKFFTSQQLKGYRISLFLKFYRNQKIKNPVVYISEMKLRWRKSKEWAEKLIMEEEDDIYLI